MTPVRELDLTEMIALRRKGDITAVDIMQSCLEAVDLYNARLNAFIAIDHQKLIDQARAADQVPAERRGLLAGIPVAIKDIIDVAGEITTAGSSFFRNHPPARSDAAIIRRLKDEGAIAFGRANLHEFAWGASSANVHYGTCYNPWHHDYVAGGSSGGSASAVLMRMAPAALGTDTLGSIRHPSSFCGTVGLKPTYGLLPTEGIFPLAEAYDHVGPMARTVADAACLFNALLTERQRGLLARRAGERTRAALSKSRRLQGLKIGVLKQQVPRELCHQAVWQGFEKVMEMIADEGGEIVEVHFPDFESAYTTGLIITMVQASQIHHQRMRTHPEQFGEDVRLLLEAGYLFSGIDYVQAQRVRAKLIAAGLRLLEGIDCWVTPTTPNPATRIGETDFSVAFLTAPICTLGFPAIALPCGATEQRLPVSFQIIGGPLCENNLLDIAGVLAERLAFPKEVPQP